MGTSFDVDGYEVRWQKWRFRIGFTPREGLVLHTLAYEDGGHVRPILYRASLSEMVVPYGDPAPTHSRKNAFDAGEYNIGTLANPLELGCDCLGDITYFDATMADSHDERHAAGDYPNQHVGGAGLPEWTAADRDHSATAPGAQLSHDRYSGGEELVDGRVVVGQDLGVADERVLGRLPQRWASWARSALRAATASSGSGWSEAMSTKLPLSCRSSRGWGDHSDMRGKRSGGPTSTRRSGPVSRPSSRSAISTSSSSSSSIRLDEPGRTAAR